MRKQETLGEQLRREAREYMADFVAILHSLKREEGRIAVGLFLAVIVMFVIWFFSALGFNPPNDHIVAFMNKFGIRQCKPVNNISGAILFIDLIMMLLLIVMSLGAMFAMVERMRQGLPRESGDLIKLGLLLLVVGVGGIVGMQLIC